MRRIPPNTRRALIALWTLLVVALTLEVGCRLWTWRTFTQVMERSPELAARLDATRKGMPRMQLERFLLPVAERPLPIFAQTGRAQAPVAWKKPAEIQLEHLRMPPRTQERQPGSVRVLFVGGSSTFDAYPQAFAALCAEQFGAGRVEVINAGVAASDSESNLLLARRLVPALAPDVVVAYEGFNDLVRMRFESKLRKVGLEAARVNPLSVLGKVQASRGVWDVAEAWLSQFASDVDGGAAELWAKSGAELAALTAQSSAVLVLTTHPAPDYAALSANDRAWFAVELQWAWPSLTHLDTLRRGLERINDATRRLAAQHQALLLDWAAQSPRGRQNFVDNCHQTQATDALHAQALLALLTPTLQTTLQRRLHEGNASGSTPAPTYGPSDNQPAPPPSSVRAYPSRNRPIGR